MSIETTEQECIAVLTQRGEPLEATVPPDYASMDGCSTAYYQELLKRTRWARFCREQMQELVSERVRTFYQGAIMGQDMDAQMTAMRDAEIKRRFELWKGRQVIATKEAKP